MDIKLYKELEDTINIYWDSLPVKIALNKVYEKHNKEDNKNG